MQIDYSTIEKLHARARRQRSEYVHCLLRRACLWVQSLIPGAPLRAEPCC